MLSLVELLGLALGVNWAAFVPAYAWQTEKFYDATGAVTFVICALASLPSGQSFEYLSRGNIATLLLLTSSLRLGWFLLTRYVAMT